MIEHFIFLAMDMGLSIYYTIKELEIAGQSGVRLRKLLKSKKVLTFSIPAAVIGLMRVKKVIYL